MTVVANDSFGSFAVATKTYPHSQFSSYVKATGITFLGLLLGPDTFYLVTILKKGLNSQKRSFAITFYCFSLFIFTIPLFKGTHFTMVAPIINHVCLLVKNWKEKRCKVWVRAEDMKS